MQTSQGSVFVCPHGVDETRVLRNLGWDVDAPILHDKEAFSAKYSPYAHQRAGAAFITMNPRGFILFEQGTGKTFTTLLGLRWLRRRGLVHSVLIVAPLSTLRDVWEREIFSVEPFAKVSVLHGSREQRRDALAADADYYIINHDGVKLLADELRADRRIDCVVIDESTAFKNARTERWKAMDRVINKADVPRRAYGLTGTPAAQAPTDAWAQSRLILPGVAPRSFVVFKESTMVQLDMHRWEARPGAKEQVMKILTPFIHVRKEDCIDLPPVAYYTREAELTKEQKKAATALRVQWMAEVEDGAVTPANAAVRLSKLLQVYQGAVISDAGDVKRLDCRPRLDLVQELVEGTEHGVLVFVPFKGVLSMVREHLEKQGITTVEVTGDVAAKKRERRFDAFRSGKAKVLIAHPETVSHGLSFVHADTIIWYGPYFSVEGYLQANERIARPGQRNHMSIYHISTSALEREIYDKLNGKVRMHAELVTLLQRVTKGGMV